MDTKNRTFEKYSLGGIQWNSVEFGGDRGSNCAVAVRTVSFETISSDAEAPAAS